MCSNQPPLLEAFLCDKAAKFFLDGGSSISIISRETLNDFGLTPMIHTTNIVIRGVTGSMNVLGTTILKLVWDSVRFFHRFVVVESPNHPGNLLLGHEFLVKAGLWLHPASNSVYFNGKRIQLLPHSKMWGSKEISQTSSIELPKHAVET
ncbi:MAG: retropepsin-like aspartic protease, partial [Cyanobacteria bacterium J06553_1]